MNAPGTPEPVANPVDAREIAELIRNQLERRFPEIAPSLETSVIGKATRDILAVVLPHVAAAQRAAWRAGVDAAAAECEHRAELRPA